MRELQYLPISHDLDLNCLTKGQFPLQTSTNFYILPWFPLNCYHCLGITVMDKFEPCQSQLPLNSSWGPNLFMDPHLVWGNLLALVQLQHILYNPHKLRNFTWKPLWAVTPEWNLSGFVCRQVSVVLLPAGLSCRVSTSKHSPESQTLCWGWPGSSPQGLKWFLSWVMCGVHNSVPFSPFKMPTFMLPKSLVLQFIL